MKDFSEMGFVEIQAAYTAITEELRRRVRSHCGCDSFSEIVGNETAKRAIGIAACGHHSIVLVGPRGVGKTMLRSAAGSVLGFWSTFECLPCPCGNRTSPIDACRCTKSQVDEHVFAIPPADMYVEVMAPAQKAYRLPPGTGNKQMLTYVSRNCGGEDKRLSGDALKLLEHACSELGLNPRRRDAAIRVAKTIAFLDSSETIESSHMAESLGYRMP